MDNLFVKTLLDSIHVLATVMWFGGMYAITTAIATLILSSMMRYL